MKPFDEKAPFLMQAIPPWYTRTLVKTLTFSLLFHLIILYVFEVHMTQVHEPSCARAPTAVSLAQTIDTTSPVIETDNPSVTHAGLITTAIKQAPLPFVYKKPAAKLPLSSLLAFDVSLPFEKSPSLPLDAAPFSQKQSIYPIKLTLSKEIASLDLLHDGSSLFKKSFTHTSFALTTPHFCKWRVKIFGRSGKVMSWHIKETSLDQKMQQYADHLLKTLLFTPSKRKWIKGTIRATFLCKKEDLEQIYIQNT